MSEQKQDTVVSMTQSQLAALIAEAAAKIVVKQQTAKAPSVGQVLALPVGKSDAKCYRYTEYFPVYHLIDAKNPSLGFVLQTSGKFAGRPKAFGFKKQNRKEIVITWANGAEVRFMKTQDSPKVHDSRTPTMSYGEDHVTSELKRVLGDDTKAVKAAKWLMNVIEFNKEDDKTQYKKCNVPNFLTYGKVYGKKKAAPRQTVAPVAPSVPLSQVAADDIPF